MITNIDHLVLTVQNVDATAAFYERVLKMQVKTFAGTRTALHFGVQKINLQTLGQEARNHAQVGSGDLCLITQWETDRLRRHLLDQGVKIVEGPVVKSGAAGPISSIYFNDPDGNLIEVSRYQEDLQDDP